MSSFPQARMPLGGVERLSNSQDKSAHLNQTTTIEIHQQGL